MPRPSARPSRSSAPPAHSQGRVYYQATSVEGAAEVVASGRLVGRESAHVFTFNERPTRQQVELSGARHCERLIRFRSTAEFERDPLIHPAVAPIARRSLFPGEVEIFDVEEVDFRRRGLWERLFGQ